MLFCLDVLHISIPVCMIYKNLRTNHLHPSLVRIYLKNNILLNQLCAYASAPSCSTRTVHLDSDSFDVCVDSGASSTCTIEKRDFIPGTFHSLTGYTINGISAGLTVMGYGTICRVIHDSDNHPIDDKIYRVLLIKDLPMRLLSPQQFANQTGGIRDSFQITVDWSILTFGGFVQKIPYHTGNHLPIFSSFPGCANFTSYATSLVADCSLYDNLTFPQRQLLKWNRQLGHMGYHKIQQFSCMGLLAKELSTVRQSDFPICPACQYG